MQLHFHPYNPKIMHQNILQNCTFAATVSFEELHQNAEKEVCNLKFKIKISADEQVLAIDDILVQIQKDKILVQKAIPRTPGQRPTQEQAQPAIQHEVSGAYANFDRSDAAIEAVMNAYVLPLYE